MKRRLLFTAIEFLVYVNQVLADGCTNYTLLSSEDIRGTNCFIYQTGSSLCDKDYSSDWYAVQENGTFLEIPTTCPRQWACSSAMPVWHNGTLPGSQGDVVDSTLCIRGALANECCKYVNTIKIKHCGTFYVYKLPSFSNCDFAYCFGDATCSSTKTYDVSNAPSSFKDLSADDPCLTYSKLHKSGYRGTGCKPTDIDSPLCDKSDNVQWYRSRYNDEFQDMPTTCPAANTCGTSSPIWLNGSLTMGAFETVERTVCVVSSSGDCCSKTYQILVKNCVSYNIYYLPYTDSCDQAYCFGSHGCTDESDDASGTDYTFMMIVVGCVSLLLIICAVVIMWRLYKMSRKEELIDDSGKLQEKESSFRRLAWTDNNKNDFY